MNIYIEFLKKKILFYVEIEHGGILLYAWNIFVCSQNNSYFLYEFFSCSEYFVFFSEKKSILMEHLYFLPRIILFLECFYSFQKNYYFQRNIFPSEIFLCSEYFFTSLSDGPSNRPICSLI